MPGATLQKRLEESRRRRQQPDEQIISDDGDANGEELGSKQPLCSVAGCDKALKEAADRLMISKQYTAAVEAYEEALGAGGLQAAAEAAVYSNRSLAHCRLGNYSEAIRDAVHASQIQPAWDKPYIRQALAYLRLGKYAAAAKACRMAEAIVNANSSSSTELALLQDEIAVSSAVEGSFDGFDGRELVVRSAGEEAWLGRAAPEDPLLDAPSASSATSLLGSQTQASTNTDLVAALSSDFRMANLQTNFRSIKDAVAAAKDGDRILLLKGIHNGMGEAINITKRVLIYGEGALAETRIDQRANSPTFRINRSCVIQNLELDMTGFRECILVQGKADVQPLLDQCIIRCSGDDAVDLCGQSSALLRGCTLQSAKCGLRAYENAHGTLRHCIIKECGEQGVKLMGNTRLELEKCQIMACNEEGVVAMDQSQVYLDACQITGCKGPGLDISARAAASVTDCTISGNVGGVWLWDDARLAARTSVIDGGSSFAMLADNNARPAMKQCQLAGDSQVPDGVWDVMAGQNVFVGAENHADFLEQPPFTFEPRLFGQ